MALIRTRSAKERGVVDDLVKKALNKTMDNITADAALYALVLEDGPSGSEVAAAVAIGLLGAVLSRKDLDDDLKNRILQTLMETMSNAERARRR